MCAFKATQLMFWQEALSFSSQQSVQPEPVSTQRLKCSFSGNVCIQCGSLADPFHSLRVLLQVISHLLLCPRTLDAAYIHVYTSPDRHIVLTIISAHYENKP